MFRSNHRTNPTLTNKVLETMFMVEWQMELTVNTLKNNNKFQSSIKRPASPPTMQVRSRTFLKSQLRLTLTLRVNSILSQVQIKAINTINSNKW